MSTRKRNLIAVAAIVTGCLFPNLASAQSEGVPEILQAIEAGGAKLLEEDWEGAIEEFDKGIALDSDGTTTRLYFGKAEALRELEDYQNAIKFYVQALQADEKFAQAYNGKGICLRELGQVDLALNDFVNASDIDRADASIAANLGDILINSFRNPAQAMPYLDRAIEKNPEDAEAYRNRGWAHTLQQEFEEGVVDLTKSIEIDPKDYETYQKLAYLHQLEENYQLAIDALTKTVEFYEPKGSSEPDTYINGYLQLADMRTKLAKEEDSLEKSHELYRAVVADADAVLAEFPDRFPESGLALFRRGVALRLQELYSEAIIALTKAIQMIPPGSDSTYSGEAYLLRGICWYYQGQNSLAFGDFKEAASQSPEDSRPHLWIGYTHAEEGDYRKAIESYGEAAAKNPAFSLPYVNRGLAYMQLKDFDKAVDNFNDAIRAEPTEPKHFYKRGRAHELLGEPQKALDSYQLALLLDGEFADANRGAARAMQALGRPELSNQYQNRASPISTPAP